MEILKHVLLGLATLDVDFDRLCRAGFSSIRSTLFIAVVFDLLGLLLLFLFLFSIVGRLDRFFFLRALSHGHVGGCEVERRLATKLYRQTSRRDDVKEVLLAQEANLGGCYRVDPGFDDVPTAIENPRTE